MSPSILKVRYNTADVIKLAGVHAGAKTETPVISKILMAGKKRGEAIAEFVRMDPVW